MKVELKFLRIHTRNAAAAARRENSGRLSSPAIVIAVLAWSAALPNWAAAVDSPPAPSASAFAATKPNTTKPPGPAPQGMVWIPGGEFSMGSDDPRGSVCGGRSGGRFFTAQLDRRTRHFRHGRFRGGNLNA